jgi:antitoxin ParD1/3/4
MKTDMRTLTVSLTPQQSARMKAAIEKGGYASNSEIVRDALRLWEQREDIRALELEQLKRAYSDGKASGGGEDVDPATFLKGLKAERSTRG